MNEWRDEKLSFPSVRERKQDPQRPQKPLTQQKPEGGMCGVIVLACVIAATLVLLNFIF